MEEDNKTITTLGVFFLGIAVVVLVLIFLSIYIQSIY
ncbi:uncharacterized protein METZ01_LOCUS79777 [marine metagenome]|uniref:Uncharacterized protein n=1 Tax=marine metagenome TaxID=408172 RepID=A0A381UJG5_9ZZZZ